MTAKNVSGKYGEYYASKYLEENGYKIIKRNYRTRLSEIDIIAMDGDVLCFVEVKTRQSKKFGTGADFVNYKKREKIILGARAYLASGKVSCDVRFDVVEVYGRVSSVGFAVDEINIIKNAFDA